MSRNSKAQVGAFSIVATWYRPPNSSTEIFSHFESLIGKFDAEYAEFSLISISKSIIGKGCPSRQGK